MSDHCELKQLAETLLACDRYTDFGRWAAALDAFEDASGPGVVLGLIEEIDSLHTAEGDALTYKAGMENVAHQRDQFKAEVEVLRKRQQSSDGYTDAFYKVASLLGIGARPLPPMEVFHGEMVPMLKAALKDAERAAYWKQRAKSAEGHLFSSDVDAGAKALHSWVRMGKTPWEELAQEDQWKCFHAAFRVVAAVNNERDRRKPGNDCGITYAKEALQ